MRFYSLKKSQGLTLIELMVTMAIIIILAMVAVPSYSTFMANERFAVASNELYNAYRFARNEALKTSTSMTLEASGAAWTVTNSSSALLSVSKIRHDSITISSSSAAVTVRGIGSLSGGSKVSFTITGAGKTSLLCIFASGQSVLRDPEKGESCS
jgi:type IV fimbrial biogenesis protein FimT